jgi:hypothetical protein
MQIERAVFCVCDICTMHSVVLLLVASLWRVACFFLAVFNGKSYIGNML